MSNAVTIHQQDFSIPDMERMAMAFAKSQLFGVKTPEQAFALMLVAQAEGRHPASAARDYDIIQGRPAKKSEAMMRDFLANGGKVEWHSLDDKTADATFSHPQGGSVRISWDHERAKKAGIGGKDMWSKYPRQMLRSRCISEGVRTVYPMATSGMYVPEEEADIDRGMKDVTPKPAPQEKPSKLGANPFPANEDPSTVGEVLDRLPPVDEEKARWVAWCKDAKTKIEAFADIDALNDWLADNDEKRRDLLAYNPATANWLANIIETKKLSYAA